MHHFSFLLYLFFFALSSLIILYNREGDHAESWDFVGLGSVLVQQYVPQVPKTVNTLAKPGKEPKKEWVPM